MALVIWRESPGGWTAVLDEVPVCALRSKDIGGCSASWLNGDVWPPPSNLPRAVPQASSFFSDVEAAKRAVEQRLLAKQD